MKVTYNDDLFTWRGTFEERNAPKEAGFSWDGKRYFTPCVEVASQLDLFADDKSLDVMCDYFNNIRGSRLSASDLKVPAPAGLDYRDFQKGGISYCKDKQQVIIADEMGLGKTIQAIGLVNLLKTRKVLVICPAFLCYNWQREMGKWLTAGIDLETISYGMLANHEHRATYDLVILDESHYIKERTAKRTKAALAVKFKKRLFLTGTPILSHPIDLWTTLHAIDAKAWGTEVQFAKKYCGAYQYQQCVGKIKSGPHKGEPAFKTLWNMTGHSNEQELQNRMRATCMVRRLKSEVLKELPAKVRQVIELDVKGYTEPKLTDVERLEFSDKVLFDRCSKIRHDTALAKVPEVIKYLKHTLDSTDGKLIVFGYHRDVLKALSDEFASCSVTVTGDSSTVIKRGCKTSDRDKAIARFQTEDGIRMVIGQIDALGVGVNLTASSHVIFVEEVWNPSPISQAEDRAHRMGQKDTVLVQHLVANNTLDSRMMHVVVFKQRVADDCLDKVAFNWREVV